MEGDRDRLEVQYTFNKHSGEESSIFYIQGYIDLPALNIDPSLETWPLWNRVIQVLPLIENGNIVVTFLLFGNHSRCNLFALSIPANNNSHKYRGGS